MVRKNTIGIVGHITAQPELIIDAADWGRKVYETKLTRTRHSGKKDIFILQFDGHAAGTVEMLKKITEGTEVLVGGEIRTENVYNPKPEENRMKVYIYAEIIAINDPPVKDQNEVTICGNICQTPRVRTTHHKTVKDKKVVSTNIIIAVNSAASTNYIPCVCYGRGAILASELEIGDHVEIYGRLQSRDYKKRIEGRKLPYLTTVYEVSVIEIKNEKIEEQLKEPKRKGEQMRDNTTK